MLNSARLEEDEPSEHPRRPSYTGEHTYKEDEDEDFTTIDWIEDAIVERNRRLRVTRDALAGRRGPNGEITLHWLFWQARALFDASQTWIIVSIAGALIGVNAAVISIVTEWLSDIKMGYCADGWWLNAQFCCWEIDNSSPTEAAPCDSWRPWATLSGTRWLVYVLSAALFAFISAHLVRTVAKYAAGSGIPEIKCILSGFIMRGFLGFWTFLVKTLTLPLVIASGLAVGKEGPSVHLACTIAYLVASLFKRFSRSHGRMRDVLTAASAAGVAVAFGAPIGGVLFSIEEMSPTFSIRTMWRSFLCALVATVTLSAMNPFRTGKLVLFQVTYDRDWHFFEIIFFVVLGIFGGLYGALVIRFNLAFMAFRRKHLARHGVAEAVFLALITASIGYFNRFLRIDMTESLAVLFRECEAGGDYESLCQTAVQWPMVNSLFLATVIRIGLVIISYGAKVPAGIFVPSMAIGASFGRMVGIIVKAIYQEHKSSNIFAACPPDAPCITPGTYAFLGAAAALSGVMRITVTVVVIMFELTGALTYILPTMIVLLVTKAVGDMLSVRGIADEAIRFNGYPFLEKDDHVYDVPVSHIMRRDVPILLSTGMTLVELQTLLTRTRAKGFPIVAPGPARTLQGHIGRRELVYALERCAAAADRPLPDDTLLAFVRSPDEAAVDPLWSAVGVDEATDEHVQYALGALSTGQLRLWPWADQTPITVSPSLPLEIVLQLFRRMGPRVILVEERGSLVGLCEVGDVLDLEEHARPGWAREGGIDEAIEEVRGRFEDVRRGVRRGVDGAIGVREGVLEGVRGVRERVEEGVGRFVRR